MKIALLKGNRFNPWHLQGFTRLMGRPSVTAFRAESEIQRHFLGRDDGSVQFDIEPIHFDTEKGPVLRRTWNRFRERYAGRAPRIVPFFERLEGFDLIQSWELFTDWSAQAVRAHQEFGIPLAVMVWDNIPFNMERNPGRRELKQRVAANADVFLVHSERSLRMLELEGVPRGRIVKLDPGVDTAKFAPGEGRRAQFGVDDGEFVILFVGWLLPRKGLDFLLLAVRELLNDQELAGRRVRLLVVGSGPGRDRVERLVSRLRLGGHCTFAGALPYDRMPEAFRAADVFALPSIATPEWQEQFGMSLIEAMSCGVPVVSTLTGAVPEIADDAGLLCQPNDFFSLYEAIKRLMLDAQLGRKLGDAARARAVERFNLDTFAGILSEVYESLAGG